MSENAIISARRRAQDDTDFQRLQDEARIANDLQAQGMARTEALKAAKKSLERRA
jgi:hypothetical protein